MAEQGGDPGRLHRDQRIASKVLPERRDPIPVPCGEGDPQSLSLGHPEPGMLDDRVNRPSSWRAIEPRFLPEAQHAQRVVLRRCRLDERGRLALFDFADLSGVLPDNRWVLTQSALSPEGKRAHVIPGQEQSVQLGQQALQTARRRRCT